MFKRWFNLIIEAFKGSFLLRELAFVTIKEGLKRRGM